MTEATMTCECCGGKWRIYVIIGPVVSGLGWTPSRWYCPACSSAEKVRLFGRSDAQKYAIEWLRQEYAHERACQLSSENAASYGLVDNGINSAGYLADSGYARQHKSTADRYEALLALIPGALESQ